MKALIISPHYDDACFSIGITLGEASPGTLLNIFTRSVHAPGLRDIPPAEAEAFVSATRREEDKKFAQAVGFRRIDVGLAEPGVSGNRPFGGSPTYPIRTIERKLMPLFVELSAAGHSLLLCPLGVGPHVDHAATSQVITKNLLRLMSLFEIGFYEELPYACIRTHARHALNKLRTAVPEIKLEQSVRVLTASELAKKNTLASFYRSQFHPHTAPDRAFTNNSPALRREVVWFAR